MKMRSKAYKTIILFILASIHIANAQNKVFGLISIEDESFSKDEVFIYDGNNKFLTTSHQEIQSKEQENFEAKNSLAWPHPLSILSSMQ